MRLSKKVYAAGALSLLVIGAAIGLAVQPNEPPKKEVVQQVATVKPQTVEVEMAPTPTPEVAPIPATVPPPTLPPKYGQDTTNPDIYRVFDKVWVMDQAGIAVNDRKYVDKMLRGWTYKTANPPAHMDINLCLMQPAEKMQRFGTDYLDNPVTQLKACDAYIKGRYGKWQAGADYFATHNNF